MHLSGHRSNNNDELVSDLLIYEPKHGRRSPRKFYIDRLKKDSNINLDENPNEVIYIDKWKARIIECRAI